jgi:hypothetical protein
MRYIEKRPEPFKRSNFSWAGAGCCGSAFGSDFDQGIASFLLSSGSSDSSHSSRL